MVTLVLLMRADPIVQNACLGKLDAVIDSYFRGILRT